MKQWGIRIKGAWMTDNRNRKVLYDMKRKAQQDADDFNSMRKRGEEPYTVKEYK